MSKFAIAEIAKIGILKAEDVEDSHVVHVPKTYPAYFGSYNRFSVIRDFTDQIENLFLVGRNGMHKYNNQDHSMLTAMTAVENIINGIVTKDNIWAINTEMEYHEEKAAK
jgi:protoporphyrinogen oxidase